MAGYFRRGSQPGCQPKVDKREFTMKIPAFIVKK
jgi:hypothetical protein